MGTLADSLFSMLMSWVRALVNAIWALFSSDHTTVLEFLGKNWMLLAAAIIAAGLVIDWIVWLLRWQPYHLWAHRVRRLLGMEEPEQEEAAPARARAAKMPERRSVYALPAQEEPQAQAEEMQMEEAQSMDEGEAQEAMAYAQHAPDEHAYPGMRYDSIAPEAMDSTQRYGAVTQEGPGAAETRRRKAEIEAWQRQMQEEARARAEAERMQREAEQARIRREAEEAERARQAAQQAEYERQLAEYEKEKARYERELAEYEQKKAEYEAHLAREAMAQEQAQELAPEQGARRRRGERRSYSDYVEAESAYDLPPAPQWPQMPEDEAQAASAPAREKHKLLHQMAKMIEPEEEQLSARTKLPPRVSMQDAYMPPAAPRKSGRRNPKA